MALGPVLLVQVWVSDPNRQAVSLLRRYELLTPYGRMRDFAWECGPFTSTVFKYFFAGSIETVETSATKLSVSGPSLSRNTMCAIDPLLPVASMAPRES